ncbi:hypothetical protein [Cytophaga sp. FL35]|uniref:hypothetical protein n=1 Tax=Cytophaga sp. FL35 TaxID=1904456 RepID=UPI00165361D2|nr:hypothetical protein [Cytophaga sp. FL35]MBC7000006.1 hypothetical protein [Cytophaga sp. FL35]
MDSFEKNIRERRKEFDVQVADRSKMWANIESRLPDSKTKVIPLWRKSIFKVAASICILLGAGALLGISFMEVGNNEKAMYASKELQDIDRHYQGLVSYQVQLIKKNSQLSDEEKQEFLSFMDELDQEYDELRKEMRNNLDNQLVLEAIVANYKKRIVLIENLLKQLNDTKIKEEEYGYTL